MFIWSVLIGILLCAPAFAERFGVGAVTPVHEDALDEDGRPHDGLYDECRRIRLQRGDGTTERPSCSGRTCHATVGEWDSADDGTWVFDLDACFLVLFGILTAFLFIGIFFMDLPAG